MFVFVPWHDLLLNMDESEFAPGEVERFEADNCGVLTEEDFDAAADDEEPE